MKYAVNMSVMFLQATLKTPPPAAESMMKGIYVAYAVVNVAYFCVACSGYAAFGNTVNADVLLSISQPPGLIIAANFMVVIHIAASYQVLSCCQPHDCDPHCCQLSGALLLISAP